MWERSTKMMEIPQDSRNLDSAPGIRLQPELLCQGVQRVCIILCQKRWDHRVTCEEAHRKAMVTFSFSFSDLSRQVCPKHSFPLLLKQSTLINIIIKFYTPYLPCKGETCFQFQHQLLFPHTSPLITSLCFTLFTLEVLLEAKRQRQVLYEAKRQRQRPLTFIILLINPSILFLTKS